MISNKVNNINITINNFLLIFFLQKKINLEKIKQKFSQSVTQWLGKSDLKIKKYFLKWMEKKL